MTSVRSAQLLTPPKLDWKIVINLPWQRLHRCEMQRQSWVSLSCTQKKTGRANNNAWCELWAETMGRLWFFTTSALPKQVKRPSRTSCHSHHPQLLFLPFTVFRDACFQSVTLQNKRVLRFSQRNYCKTNCSNSKRHRLLGLGFSKTRLGMVFPLWFFVYNSKKAPCWTVVEWMVKWVMLWCEMLHESKLEIIWNPP